MTELTDMPCKEEPNILWEAMDFALSQLSFEFSQSSNSNLLAMFHKLAPKRGTHALIPYSLFLISTTNAFIGAWSLLCEEALSETEALFSQNKLQHLQDISRTIDPSIYTISNYKVVTNKLASTRPTTYIHRSDSIITFTPSHLLMRRKLSPITPIAGASFTLEFSLHQRDLYKIVWSRRRSEILKIFTPGSKWGTLHPSVQRGSTCLLISPKGLAGKVVTN